MQDSTRQKKKIVEKTYTANLIILKKKMKAATELELGRFFYCVHWENFGKVGHKFYNFKTISLLNWDVGNKIINTNKFEMTFYIF